MEIEHDVTTWWKKKGYRELNKVLIDLVGEGIGYVPLQNLISFKLDSESQEELIPLMVKDGCTLRSVKMSNGKRELLIYIR